MKSGWDKMSGKDGDDVWKKMGEKKAEFPQISRNEEIHQIPATKINLPSQQLSTLQISRSYIETLQSLARPFYTSSI
jgi:hypothetical protein